MADPANFPDLADLTGDRPAARDHDDIMLQHNLRLWQAHLALCAAHSNAEG